MGCISGIAKQAGLFTRFLTLADISPKECLAIGDSLQDDMKPAQSLGIQTIHYDVHTCPTACNADAYGDSLDRTDVAAITSGDLQSAGYGQ